MKKVLLICLALLAAAVSYGAVNMGADEYLEPVGPSRRTCVLQGFLRFQSSERPRNRVETTRSGCFRAGGGTGAVNHFRVTGKMTMPSSFCSAK